MKLKVLVFLLLITLALTAFAGCNLFKPDSGGEGTNPPDGGTPDGSDDFDDPLIEGKNVIFSPKTSVTIIKGDVGEHAATLLRYTETLYDLTGSLATLNSDAAPKTTSEIVIGNSAREVTKNAYNKLDEIIAKAKVEFEYEGGDPTYLSGYAIYCEGNSLAVVWSDDEIAKFALEFFEQNFLTAGTLALDEGYLYYKTDSILNVYREEENAQREAKYQQIAETFGEPTAQALRNHLSMFDERFYLWLADLYDPGLYDDAGNPLGGGFYFSNSGRDTPGFGIDLETTYQVLSFLSASGMIKSNEYMTLFPEKIQKEIVTFALKCQSPIDGYFYHPQWGTDIGISRISRDMSWAVSILSHFGYKPYWNTPGGTAGEHGDPPGEDVSPVSKPLSMSTDFAVSKVVATAGGKKWTGSAQLATIDAWRSYLLAFEPDIHKKSYSIGSTLTTQSSQIKNREKIALENKELFDTDGDGIAENGYIRAYEYYMNKWQLPENGLWEEGNVKDRSVTYASINGLMKISGTYQSLGIKYPNAQKALECAIFMVTYLGDGTDWSDVNGEEPSGSVDVYNPWIAIGRLIENIAKFGSAEEAAALRAKLAANSEELIKVTTTKIAKFKKDDGSYGYNWGGVGGNSMGVPVAVAGTMEGDVNGGGIAFTGTFGAMCSALGISGLKPFGHSDMLVFIDRISSLEPVIKDDAVLIEATPVTFDDEDIDETAPSRVRLSMNTGSVVVIEDDRDPTGEGKAIRYTTKKGSGSYIYIPTSTARNANCFTLEWDMAFDETTFSGSAFQVRLSSAYMLNISLKNGKITVGDSSSTTGSVAITNTFFTEENGFDWHTYKIEYYLIDTSNNSTLTKIYFDGKLRAVSSNYFGKEADATPSISYKEAFLYALNGAEFSARMDNLFACSIVQNYVEEPIYNPDRLKDFESSKVGGELPSGVSSENGSVVLSPTEKNENNLAFLLSGKGASATFTSTSAAPNPNAYTFFASMKVGGDKLGEIGKISIIGNSSSTPIAVYKISVYEEGDSVFASLTELDSSGKSGAVINALPTDEWFEIGIEFFPYRYQTEETSVFYVNGAPAGYGSLYYSEKTVGRDFTGAVVALTANGGLCLDDVIVEAVAKVYVDKEGNESPDPEISLPKGGASSSTAAQSGHNGRFDYEGDALGVPAIPGLSTSVNKEPGNKIEIEADPLDAANKVLHHVAMSSTAAANYSSYIVSKVSPKDANCLVYSFDLLVESFTSGGLQPTVYAKGSDGKTVRIFETNTILSGNWVTGTGTITTRSEVKETSSVVIIPSRSVSGWLNVRYEIYFAERVVQIYYDDVCVAETDLFYEANSVGSTPTELRMFTTKASTCSFFLDNVVAEAIVKDYEKKMEISQGGSGTDAGSGSDSGNTPTTSDFTGEFDFDSSALGSPSISGLSYTVKSEGSLSVVQDPEDAANRLLAFESKPGAGDTLTFTASGVKAGETVKKMVFEFDIRFEYSNWNSEVLYQLFMNESYLFTVGITSGGVLCIGDASGTIHKTSHLNNFTVAGTDAKKWNTVRVEYGLVDGTPTSIVSLNGKVVAESNNFFDPDNTGIVPKFDVTSLRWYAVKSVDAKIYLDNVKAQLSSEEVK